MDNEMGDGCGYEIRKLAQEVGGPTILGSSSANTPRKQACRRACVRACNYLDDVSTAELRYRGTEFEAGFLDSGGIMKPYGDDI